MLKGVRRAAVIVILVGVAITAVIGIAVLLTGSFGEVQARVLGTAGAVAVFAALALCHLAQAGRPLRLVGYAGIAVSVAALALALLLVWHDWATLDDWDLWGQVWKWFAVLAIAAATLAHANLLLLLATRRHPAVRWTLWATLAAIAAVAVMLWIPILSDGRVPGAGASDGYWRGFGVAAILDGVGTIVLPVLGGVLREARGNIGGGRALVVVDVQQGFDDPSWGPTANRPGAEENVARLIAAWERAGQPIVVVRHDSRKPGSPLAPGQPGNELKPEAAVAAPALRIAKSVNSAFYGEPSLDAWLRREGIGEIVVCGIQTNMCVETTARMGGNLGYAVTVPLDATRTFDLETTLPDGSAVRLRAEELVRATAVNLAAGGFARVVSTDEAIAALSAAPGAARA